MRKTKTEIATLMNRIENLARKEHRDIVGQMTNILEVYEKATGLSGKRPYNRKPKELVQEKTLKKRKVVASKGVMKKRPYNLSEKGRSRIVSAQKMRHARKKLLAQKAVH